jgi:NAD(P)-dependent dehydrogenase (short-subunit alcohol dehydrogenase family)
MQVSQLFDLSGRTALVTGGGRGIGRHVALGLAEAGADVIVASRKRENLDETVRLVEKTGRRAWAIEADLSQPESTDTLVRGVFETVPRLDVLVANAGFAWGQPVLEHGLAGWDKVYDLNVRGTFYLCQQVAQRMKEAGGGNLILVSSISGLRGSRDEEQPSVAYNTSKGAVITLTKELAVKLAPFGIRVNGIAPGPFVTDMMDHMLDHPERWAEFRKRIPLDRAGEADDIKGVAVFLASDASRYVAGHTLVVDGGIMAM